LIIPKKHLGDFLEINDSLLVRIKNKIIELVNEMGMAGKGYRVVVNGGAAKAVPHLHFHLLGEVSVERGV
jgi:diadenosine tetraphosphate (Ap4A) HIT family hydrolase